MSSLLEKLALLGIDGEGELSCEESRRGSVFTGTWRLAFSAIDGHV
jgi:hypothetical protein